MANEIFSNEMQLDDWKELAATMGYTVEWDEQLNTYFAETDGEGSEIKGTYCLDEDCTTKAWMELKDSTCKIEDAVA